MLGAIYGDLAAWTYENEKDFFYSGLIHPYAELSEVGKAALESAVSIAGSTQVPEHSKGYSEHISEAGPILIGSIQAAWAHDDLLECKSHAEQIRQWVADKEGCYFINIAVEAMLRLRKGGTKKSLDEMKGCFSFDTALHFAHDGNSSASNSIAYLGWAKEVLDESWDFTSAMHLAVKKPGDRHFLFSVVGALAEAAYGCEMCLLKQKYVNEVFQYIEYPDNLAKQVCAIKEYDFSHRHFFPKNSAMTNVEVVHWEPVKSKYEGQVVSSSFARGIRRAFYTDWKNRYGFYLDNGWEYVYRSGHLLARFRLVDNGFDTFRICDVQSHGHAKIDIELAMHEALCSTPEE